MGLREKKQQAAEAQAQQTTAPSPFDNPAYLKTAPKQFEVKIEAPVKAPVRPPKTSAPVAPPVVASPPVKQQDARPERRDFLSPDEVTRRLKAKRGVTYWLVPNGETDMLDALKLELRDAPVAAFDFETNSADDEAPDARVVGISFSTKRGTGYYLPIWHDGYPANWPVSILHDFKFFFCSHTKIKVAFNAAFEARWLRLVGIILAEPIFDPMIGINLLKIMPKYRDPATGRPTLGLKGAVKHVFDHQMPTYEQTVGNRQIQVGVWGTGKPKEGIKKGDPKFKTILRTFNETDPTDPDVLEYVCGDSDWALALRDEVLADLAAWDIQGLADDIDNPLVLVLDEMRANGWACNIDVLVQQLRPVAVGKKLWWEVSVYQDIYKLLRMPMDEGLAESLRVTMAEIEGAWEDRERLNEINPRLEALTTKLSEGLIVPIGKDPKPFNLGSGNHLGWLLFDQLKMPILSRTNTGKAQLDEETLNKLEEKFTRVKRDPASGAIMIGTDGKPEKEIAIPLFGKILEWRGFGKILSTYIDGYAANFNMNTGRFHALIDQIFVRTGRFACKNPNLQNCPRPENDPLGIRSAFWAPEMTTIFVPGGKSIIRPEPTLFVFVDYSQIELRVFVHYSGEPGMKAAFERGDDIHGYTAQVSWNLPCEANAVKDLYKEVRSKAKAVIFGLIYGATEYSISETVGCSLEEARQIIRTLMTSFRGIPDYMAWAVAFAREHGYTENMFGRRREIPNINSHNKWQRANAERQAINTPIQGSAGEIIKLAMVRIQRKALELGWFQRGFKLSMQIHDELVLEVPVSMVKEVTALVKHTMEEPIEGFEIPIEAEAAIGWKWNQKLDFDPISGVAKIGLDEELVSKYGSEQAGALAKYGETLITRLELAGISTKYKVKPKAA